MIAGHIATYLFLDDNEKKVFLTSHAERLIKFAASDFDRRVKRLVENHKKPAAKTKKVSISKKPPVVIEAEIVK